MNELFLRFWLKWQTKAKLLRIYGSEFKFWTWKFADIFFVNRCTNRSRGERNLHRLVHRTNFSRSFAWWLFSRVRSKIKSSILLRYQKERPDNSQQLGAVKLFQNAVKNFQFYNQTFSVDDNGQDKDKGWVRGISSLGLGSKLLKISWRIWKKSYYFAKFLWNFLSLLRNFSNLLWNFYSLLWNFSNLLWNFYSLLWNFHNLLWNFSKTPFSVKWRRTSKR